jgi:hypothetical protein
MEYRGYITMPKQIEEEVKSLLGKPDFYPDKSEEERERLAYAIATKQYKRKSRIW